jgi:YVTN family beta-propeller protein
VRSASRHSSLLAWTGVLVGVGVAVGVARLLGSSVYVDAPPPAGEPSEPSLPLAPPYVERMEHEGVAVELEIQALTPGRAGPTAHESTRFRFSIHDTANRAPVVGAYPAAWMQRRRDGEPAPDADGCGTLVKTFLEGSIFAQPDVDLNVYTVLVLNDDASISVVDPRFGFGGTKLLTMIPLPGPGHDWTLRDDDGLLFVSIPDVGRVVFIETYDYRPVAEVAVGEATRRLRLQPDEQYLWAAGGGTLTAIDVDEREVVATLPLGQALDELAVSDDSRWVFVADRTANRVSVVDTGTLTVHGVVESGWEPVSMDWSRQARALYVANRGQGTISIIDPVGPRVTGEIVAEAGLGELRFAPDGRFGFVVNNKRDLLHVFDSASGSLIQSGRVAPGPDHVAFSNELAYVRHGGSDTIFMVHLDELGPGLVGRPLQVVDFPAGHSPFGRRSTPAAGIVKAPGENAMLVAHPIDRAVYFYKEGMAAPMGHFQSYGRRARAVLAVDRSLTETATRGVYETAVRLGEAGTYDLAFFLDSPRILHCFSVEVAANPEHERRLAPPIVVEWELGPEPPRVGEPFSLELRLVDSREEDQPLAELDDVIVSLELLAPEAHRYVSPAVGLGEGRYRATFSTALAGPYVASVRAPSVGLRGVGQAVSLAVLPAP